MNTKASCAFLTAEAAAKTVTVRDQPHPTSPESTSPEGTLRTVLRTKVPHRCLSLAEAKRRTQAAFDSLDKAAHTYPITTVEGPAARCAPIDVAPGGRCMVRIYGSAD